MKGLEHFLTDEPNTHDDDEYSTCEDCGGDSHWEDCWQCGGEGGTDGEELMMEDPLWYGPDDFRKCDICHGKGGYYVCVEVEKCSQNDTK